MRTGYHSWKLHEKATKHLTWRADGTHNLHQAGLRQANIISRTFKNERNFISRVKYQASAIFALDSYLRATKETSFITCNDTTLRGRETKYGAFH